jgi:hypothetical protein
MSAIAPVAASSFAPEERPQQLTATQAGPLRTGRHEPIRSSTARLLALRGADRVALSQAARQAAGDPAKGRALGLLGRVVVLRALL